MDEMKPLTAREWELHGTLTGLRVAVTSLRQENATLKAEVERLRSGYLADENGNEYVAVCILKEKIKELQTKLEKARVALEFYADPATLGRAIKEVKVGGLPAMQHWETARAALEDMK